jgi:uracil-DNA glycosylase
MADLSAAWNQIQKDIIGCNRCPRLREHCLKIAETKKKAHLLETYWGKPIPAFGDGGKAPTLWIVGLAPAAHGANRTGRMFTGDRSGDWLYRALFEFGFANQAESRNANDGLKLHSTVISATARCAPPDNKPLPDEIQNCSEYLRREWEIIRSTCRVVMVLGKIAHDHTWRLLGHRPPAFKHGFSQEIELEGKRLKIISSFHPSQQNTFTGRLTKPMFDSIFQMARGAI